MTVTTIFQFDIRRGQETAFHDAVKESVAAARDDEGVLEDHWFVDGRVCALHKAFCDSEALVDHMVSCRGILSRLMQAGRIRSLHVYGTVGPAGRDVLLPFGPLFYESMTGFSRMVPEAVPA